MMLIQRARKSNVNFVQSRSSRARDHQTDVMQHLSKLYIERFKIKIASWNKTWNKNVSLSAFTFNGHSFAFIYIYIIFFLSQKFAYTQKPVLYYNFSRKHSVYVCHWRPCGQISISIKDGAHVSLDENAAGILKWFGGVPAGRARLTNQRIYWERGEASRARAMNVRRKYSIVYSAGVAVW